MTPGSPSALAAARVLERLGPAFADKVTVQPALLAAHGRGEGGRSASPDAVVFPRSTAEVAAVVAACAAERCPVIPYGAGTSLEGQLEAVRGGVCLDLSGMDEILDVSGGDLDCRVQAGVRREQLNRYTRDLGLFFPLDPGADATLGGMAATRASGTNAVRYGTMRDVVLGLTVVTPDGQVIRTGSRARKSAAGYDLTRLYVGSEGTLGVITELQLRLFGIPEAVLSGVCAFADLSAAVAAVTLILQAAVPVARLELLDELQMKASVRHSRLEGFEAKPTVFIELHGSTAAVEEQSNQIAALLLECGGGGFRTARTPEERNRLWKARHDAYWAGRALAPGTESIATDACVPISRLADCILEARGLADEAGLIAPVTGHVGDGNFHMLILFTEGRRDAAEALAREVGRLAIARGGTCTGEHGVGLHKLDLLREEHGAAVDVMAALKEALDPLDIMNPGKTTPRGGGGGRLHLMAEPIGRT